METPSPLADDQGKDLDMDKTTTFNPLIDFITPLLVDNIGIEKDKAVVSKSNVVTLEPYNVKNVENSKCICMLSQYHYTGVLT